MVTPTPSEFALFQKLANPQKTDFSKPAVFRQAVHSQVFSQARGSMAPPPPPSAPPGRNRSLMMSRVAKVDEESSSTSSRSSRHSRHSRSSRHSRHSSPSRSPEPPHPHPFAAFAGSGLSEMSANNYGGHGLFHEGAPGFAQSHPVDAHLQAEIEREKQGYLLELMKYKTDGIQLTRDYTMDDSLVDIQFEFDRIKNQLETVSNVAFVRDMLFLGFQGIELANSKWGPVLELQGWSGAVQEDKEKYNRVLERLYKKHWRFGSMSPEAEFGWLIGSSMVRHHISKKWGLSTGSSSSSKGGGGGGFNPLNMMGNFFKGSATGGVPAAPPTPPMAPSAPPPAPQGGGGRPIMSRPVMRGAPSFNVPPGEPLPTSHSNTMPEQSTQPDPAIHIMQEQRKELERELQHARNELKQMQAAMNTQQQQMHTEFTRQQYTHYQQMEAMQQHYLQQQRALSTPAPAGAAGAAGAGATRMPVSPPTSPPTSPPASPRSSNGDRHISSDSDDEDAKSDKEVSIVGVPTVLPPAGRRRGAALPALKLDL